MTIASHDAVSITMSEELSLPPRVPPSHHLDQSNTSSVDGSQRAEVVSMDKPMKVLFVDDDRVLRKLGTRALARTMPRWTVREAASGETACRILEKEKFDILFVDSYMAAATRVLQNRMAGKTNMWRYLSVLALRLFSLR